MGIWYDTQDWSESLSAAKAQADLWVQQAAYGNGWGDATENAGFALVDSAYADTMKSWEIQPLVVTFWEILAQKWGAAGLSSVDGWDKMGVAIASAGDTTYNAENNPDTNPLSMLGSIVDPTTPEAQKSLMKLGLVVLVLGGVYVWARS